MKVVILAGGRGSRLSEETIARPKPMIEIGGIPILVHVMNIYAAYGHAEFVVALGYRGDIIKDYFVNYHLRNSDLAIQLRTGQVSFANSAVPDWTVHLVDTGQDTMTGGRVRRLDPMLRGGGTFMLTYGDGVANVDLAALLRFHQSHGRLATVTAVRPPGRFGTMVLHDGRVDAFKEKPQAGEGWINGGFFVFEPPVLDYLDDDASVLEQSPLERLTADNQLCAFRHEGFWQPMDTVRDRDLLNDLWRERAAPWVIGAPAGN